MKLKICVNFFSSRSENTNRKNMKWCKLTMRLNKLKVKSLNQMKSWRNNTSWKDYRSSRRSSGWGNRYSLIRPIWRRSRGSRFWIENRSRCSEKIMIKVKVARCRWSLRLRSISWSKRVAVVASIMRKWISSGTFWGISLIWRRGRWRKTSISTSYRWNKPEFWMF